MKIIHCSDLHLDADLRGRVTAAAEAEVREKYSWDIITDRLLDFYSEVQRLHRRR